MTNAYGLLLSLALLAGCNTHENFDVHVGGVTPHPEVVQRCPSKKDRYQCLFDAGHDGYHYGNPGCMYWTWR